MDKSSSDYKKEADLYAEKMKYYFEKSQNAWKNGEKAEAKLFSNKGNEYKILLKEANQEFHNALQIEKENRNRNSKITESTVSNVAFYNNYKVFLDTDVTNNNDLVFKNKNNEIIDSNDVNDVCRHKSFKYGKKMKEAFEISQRLWESGEKGKAKEYSDLGHKFKEKMNTYNSVAVKVIASSNNNERDYDELDLHGLYVKEALQLFYETVKVKIYGKLIDNLKVITGKGLHSKDGPKIKEAIIMYCIEKKLFVSEEYSNEGCLIVSLN